MEGRRGANEPGPQDAAITRLLRELGDGDAGAAEALAPLLYDDLRRIAQSQLRSERAAHTLQPTALVHEAWMRLKPGHAAEARSRERYLALAARVMRSVLVDHARRRKSQKRDGGGERVPLTGMVARGDDTVDVLALHDALEQLARSDQELARIAEMHVFAGMQQKEVAAALGISLSTVERRWRVAGAWLRKELGP